MGNNNTKEQYAQEFSSVNLGSYSERENPNFGNIDIVHVAYKCDVCDLDTEQGYIKVIDSYIDDPLPLCINDANVGDWFLLLEVRGGYHFMGGTINFYQKGEWAGYLEIILLSETHKQDCECCYTEVELGVWADCHSFCLDSNQYPELIGFDNCWMELPEGQSFDDGIPGKDVDLSISMTWAGCGEEDQSFKIIPAQKYDISRSPTPKKIFIASYLQ
ncbi:MAG: hypothetical protein ACFFHD_08060 [Promethearchaeota archaeon]